MTALEASLSVVTTTMVGLFALQVDFFILQRGRVPDGLFAYERNTPKDMLFLGPGEELWVLVRFGAHRGEADDHLVPLPAWV